MSVPNSASSRRPLLSPNKVAPANDGQGIVKNGAFFRDATSLSTNDIQYNSLLDKEGQATEETFYEVEISNPELSRKASRSELASKSQCLTRRWQTALVSTIILLALGGGIGGLAYWLTLAKVITQPYLLYDESCYMNSRSCDATRMLWCPAGKCICIGNFHWDSTAQNCSCGAYQQWVNVKCQDYGAYGDPCNTVPCNATLTCLRVINQTFTTSQDVCVCDSTTYLSTSGSTRGQCIPRLPYNSICQTNSDCQSWLGLACTSSSGLRCLCAAQSYWNGSICVRNALGWQPCSVTVPCDTSVGLTCSGVSNTCECNSLSYWDNVTTLTCLAKKTYAVSCQFNFQCNTTVNLSCPGVTTGCSCPTSSGPNICDCQAAQFWDGQRCIARHIFNGTCPGQYACSSNLVCFLGHCICPGNMVWNTPTPNACACASSTTWNNVTNQCITVVPG